MAYAIIETGGAQFRIEKDSVLTIPSLNKEIDEEIVIDKVLLFSDGEQTLVGKPFLDNIKVKAKILSHGKGRKIKVFKFKRRKDYKKLQGHRQKYTEIQITGIDA